MALPILDGNQSATTLSTILDAGQHIPAHTVVSLGSQAISEITGAVSGSVVSVSNFPASQVVSVSNFPSTQTIAGTVNINANFDSYGNLYVTPQGGDNPYTFPIFGTVTANGLALGQEISNVFPIGIGQVGGGGVRAVADYPGYYVPVAVREIVDVAGTVTAAAPNGALTTRFGTPTTANTAFATSAVTNASRKYLLIQNVTTGSNVITVGIGFTPTTTQGIQLTAGAGITFESSYIPTGAVYVLSSVTASNFTILEA